MDQGACGGVPAKLAEDIFNHPELAEEEVNSAGYLRKYMEDLGFPLRKMPEVCPPHLRRPGAAESRSSGFGGIRRPCPDWIRALSL